MTKDTTLTIRLPHAVRERLEAVAKRLNRSKSFLAGEAIEEFVAVQEWQVAGIEDAIRSLDAGKGVAHDEVVRWIESWDGGRERPRPGPKPRS